MVLKVARASGEPAGRGRATFCFRHKRRDPAQPMTASLPTIMPSLDHPTWLGLAPGVRLASGKRQGTKVSGSGLVRRPADSNVAIWRRRLCQKSHVCTDHLPVERVSARGRARGRGTTRGRARAGQSTESDTAVKHGALVHALMVMGWCMDGCMVAWYTAWCMGCGYGMVHRMMAGLQCTPV